MSPLVLLIATAAFGIEPGEAGWEPLPDGGYEYTLQIDPQVLEPLKRGTDEIVSDVPPQLNVRRFRVIVGTGQVPKVEGAPRAGEPQAAIKQPEQPAPELNLAPPEAALPSEPGAARRVAPMTARPRRRPDLENRPIGSPARRRLRCRGPRPSRRRWGRNRPVSRRPAAAPGRKKSMPKSRRSNPRRIPGYRWRWPASCCARRWRRTSISRGSLGTPGPAIARQWLSCAPLPRLDRRPLGFARGASLPGEPWLENLPYAPWSRFASANSKSAQNSSRRNARRPMAIGTRVAASPTRQLASVPATSARPAQSGRASACWPVR